MQEKYSDYNQRFYPLSQIDPTPPIPKMVVCVIIQEMRTDLGVYCFYALCRPVKE